MTRRQQVWVCPVCGATVGTICRLNVPPTCAHGDRSARKPATMTRHQEVTA